MHEVLENSTSNFSLGIHGIKKPSIMSRGDHAKGNLLSLRAGVYADETRNGSNIKSSDLFRRDDKFSCTLMSRVEAAMDFVANHGGSNGATDDPENESENKDSSDALTNLSQKDYRKKRKYNEIPCTWISCK